MSPWYTVTPARAPMASDTRVPPLVDQRDERAEVEAVLAILQDFDPPGVCARNLTECLSIQHARDIPAVRAESEVVVPRRAERDAHRGERLFLVVDD